MKIKYKLLNFNIYEKSGKFPETALDIRKLYIERARLII